MFMDNPVFLFLIFQRKELVDTGYLEVIYDALKKLLTLREPAYIYPLYNCISIILRTSEYYESTNCLEVNINGFVIPFIR